MPSTASARLSDAYCRVLAAIGDGKVTVAAGLYTFGGGDATPVEVDHIRRAVEVLEHADHDINGRYFLTMKGLAALKLAWPMWEPKRRH